MTNPEPMLDIAHGDVAASRQLKHALRIISANSRDPELKKQIDDIVAGRASARELIGADAFNRVLDQAMPGMKQFEDMPEEERARLAEQGAVEVEGFRNAPSDAPSAEPAPSRAPLADDVRIDDDDYFLEQRRTGFLE